MNSDPHIKQFIRNITNTSILPFNDSWFERSDEKAIKSLQDIILACERDRYFTLKVLSFRVVEDYEEIQRLLYNKYDNKTKNGKLQDNDYNYISLKDSSIMILVVNYYIKINKHEDQRRKDRNGILERMEGTHEVLICIPKFVNKYYYYLLGNFYSPMFQIVDGSTYNGNSKKTQSTTLKNPFMPIVLYKENISLTDIFTKESVQSVIYTSRIFTKKNDAMKYILGRYGLYGTIDRLELDYIYVGPNVIDDPLWYNFKCKDKVTTVSIPRDIFDNDTVSQSLVATLTRHIWKYDNINEIYDPRFWNRSLGGDFLHNTLDKGIPILDSFESIYDAGTKDNIKLPDEEKSNTYDILRWMMREFINLKAKDNYDISTKRAVMADQYISRLYAKKLSSGIYRISDKGKNVSYVDVLRVIDIDPMYIITKIGDLNLVPYVNDVNDNDAQIALDFTFKGLSGIGEKKSSNVPAQYRMIHPSYLGRIDLDASSASDPGLSGSICPFSFRDDDGSFSKYEEPSTWKDKYNSTLEQFKDNTHFKQILEIDDLKAGKDFDYIKDDLINETITEYSKMIPIIIDIDGVVDYTINDDVLPNKK